MLRIFRLALLASGVIAGGLVDNFTRVSHAHGADFAAELWRFGDLAYCTDYLESWGRRNSR
mgnify:CR=1 FL=1